MTNGPATEIARGPFARLRDALRDPRRGERTVLLLLAGYVLVWTAYGTIAKSGQPLHPDMTEMIAWSRDLSFGYLKHPPLAAWLVALWFAVFPVAPWSYYLLAMLMPAIALWIAWRLSADYLDVEKRIWGLAMLTFIPFFNFHALKFNANTVLLPLWAAATWWFLRSYGSRAQLYAALAGLAAGAAMLGKYWSIFLVGGLALAALIDRRRAAYFRSAAPWIAAACGFAVLAPHLVWLVQHDFATFKYALAVHGNKAGGVAALSGLGYLAGALGYIAAPLAVVAIATRGRPPLADMLWPKERERRLVALAFWAPLLLPLIPALLAGADINSLWSMSAWTLLPVLLLSPPAVVASPAGTRAILMAAVAMPLAMLAAAPVIARMLPHNGLSSAQAGRLMQAVETSWRETTHKPLRFVDGDAAYLVAAYSPDRPRALHDMPQPAPAELARDGVLTVCTADDLNCVRASKRAAENRGRQVNVDIPGYAGPPARFVLTIVPPAQ